MTSTSCSGEYPTFFPESRTGQTFKGEFLSDVFITKTGGLRERHCLEQKELVSELARLWEPMWDILNRDWSMLKKLCQRQSRTSKSAKLLRAPKKTMKMVGAKEAEAFPWQE